MYKFLSAKVPKMKSVLRIRILIFTHLGSRIPDPKNRNKREGWKKFVVILFLLTQISQNCKLFKFWNAGKKIWANFQRIIELFTQKNVTKLSKIWVWDLGSGIRDPGSGSATLGEIRRLSVTCLSPLTQISDYCQKLWKRLVSKPKQGNLAWSAYWNPRPSSKYVLV